MACGILIDVNIFTKSPHPQRAIQAELWVVRRVEKLEHINTLLHLMHLLRIPNVQWLQSGGVDMSRAGHTPTVQMDRSRSERADFGSLKHLRLHNPQHLS